MNSFVGWIGGKRLLRTTILQCFPNDVGRYIEVFGGAGWILFAKDQKSGQMEVFNDMDGNLINLYRCIKYHCEAVQSELDWLLFSREQFIDYRNLIKCSFGCDHKTFATAPKSMERATEYLTKVKARLKNVVIEQKDFADLIRVYDRTEALFYLDPPYTGTELYYEVPFTSTDHQRLYDVLRNIKGRFILSYNDDPEICCMYKDFHIDKVDRNNTLSGKSNAKQFKELIITNF